MKADKPCEVPVFLIILSYGIPVSVAKSVFFGKKDLPL